MTLFLKRDFPFGYHYTPFYLRHLWKDNEVGGKGISATIHMSLTVQGSHEYILAKQKQQTL